MTPQVVVTERGPVEVAEIGSGPAVLVVHGTPGDWRQARVLAEDLADRHRVLLPSRPGYGRTPLGAARTPRQQAASYAALLDALGVDRAAVVGISGGGPSARAFAAHERRCTRLVLCCAVAEHLVTVPVAMRLLATVPGVWEVAARVAAGRGARRLRDREAALAEAFAGLGPAERAVADDDPRVADDLLAFSQARLRAMTSVAGLRNDVGQFHGASAPAPWPVDVDVPTLVLHGNADDVVPLRHGEHHRDTIPGAELQVLPGAGHGFVLALRRQTSARIAEFVA